MSYQDFNDPFNGWGDVASKFCIAFALIAPNLLLMKVALGWF